MTQDCIKPMIETYYLSHFQEYSWKNTYLNWKPVCKTKMNLVLIYVCYMVVICFHGLHEFNMKLNIIFYIIFYCHYFLFSFFLFISLFYLVLFIHSPPPLISSAPPHTSSSSSVSLQKRPDLALISSSNGIPSLMWIDPSSLLRLDQAS